jgi:hypothetical protein
VTNNETTQRRTAFIVAVLIGSAIGLIWDVLSALILFRSYTFFESVVVCLLVMLLCSVATIRADWEPGGFLHRGADNNTDASDKDEDSLRRVPSLAKTIFYGIAFVMALVKLVMALIENG